jgi:hypothetical protein
MLASPPPIACKQWLAVRISRRMGAHHWWATLVWQANRSGASGEHILTMNPGYGAVRTCELAGFRTPWWVQ